MRRRRRRGRPRRLELRVGTAPGGCRRGGDRPGLFPARQGVRGLDHPRRGRRPRARRRRLPARPEVPELYFARDLKGYGWCFRKQGVVNVGYGRFGGDRLSAHVAGFLDFLRGRGRLPASVTGRLKGHAYLIYGSAPRPLVDDGVLLVGDAAGLAYPQSGEGIRPAVESGLLAARVLLGARGRYGREDLAPYHRQIEARL